MDQKYRKYLIEEDGEFIVWAHIVYVPANADEREGYYAETTDGEICGRERSTEQEAIESLAAKLGVPAEAIAIKITC